MGILTQPQPAGWLWGRVAGDMLDLASLGSALRSDINDKPRVAMATAAVLGVTALDVICAQQMSQSSFYKFANRTRRISKDNHHQPPARGGVSAVACNSIAFRIHESS